ncbi:MAG: type II toxin-antitoxin system RelE/ParE family toxin [Methanobacteriota archaeon]
MAEIAKRRREKWQVIWTEPAYDDITEIVEYINLDSKHYASIVAQGIYDAGESLSIFPLRGRIVPEFDRQDFREIFYQSYRVIYKIESERIAILAIVHSSRDIASLITKRPLDIN